MGAGVLLEPRITDVRQWFTELDRFKTAFMKKGTRQQPPTPHREIFD